MKEQIKPVEQRVMKVVIEKYLEYDEAYENHSEKTDELHGEYEAECHHAVRVLIDEISTLLHNYKI